MYKPPLHLGISNNARFRLFDNQTTLNADCKVDENREAIVSEANCWICFLASERKTSNFDHCKLLSWTASKYEIVNLWYERENRGASLSRTTGLKMWCETRLLLLICFTHLYHLKWNMYPWKQEQLDQMQCIIYYYKKENRGTQFPVAQKQGTLTRVTGSFSQTIYIFTPSPNNVSC